MSIEGRYRRVDGKLTIIEIVAIPGESRYTMVKTYHTNNPGDRLSYRERDTIALPRHEEFMEWKKGSYHLEMLFEQGQLMVVEHGFEQTRELGFPIEGAYRKAGVMVVVR